MTIASPRRGAEKPVSIYALCMLSRLGICVEVELSSDGGLPWPVIVSHHIRKRLKNAASQDKH